MIAGILEIQMMANMARLSDDMRRAERVVGDSMGKVEKSVASAKRAMSSLGMGLSIGLIADQMRRTADTFTKLDAQIRLSTKSQQQYNQALADIRRISTVAQSDISATTMLYTRMMNVMQGTGIEQSKLATVTATVSYGLKAYGASAQESASAMLQLSQAMGSGRLGGEEFRAVSEAMPPLMAVLAKSMRVPIGELRNLSIAGKITPAEIVKAFSDPKVAKMFEEMAKKAQTITGAWTSARNEFTLAFGEFAKSSGITAGMIAAFNGLAAALRTTGQYISDLVILFGAWAAMRVIQMVYGYVAALMAQRAAALAAAQAELYRVNMTYGASAASVTAARASYAYAAANTTLGGSLMILGQRMAAFVSANAAAIAIVSLGVAALALKRDFDAAIDSVGKFQEKIRGMEVDALRAARQLEVANVAAMKSSIFSGFNERDILFAERRIRMMDAQIIAAEKLAKAESIIPSTGGKPAKDRTTIFERMTVDMRAAIEAERYGRLNNVEKVAAAWAKLNDQQKADAKYLSDYKMALAEAEIADEQAKREALVSGISESLMRAAKSGNVGKSIRDDIQAAFEKEVILPEVKVMVSAGVDWVKALVANTLAIKSASTKDTTDKGSTWGWIILIVAAIFDLVRTVKTADFIRGTATRGGFTGVRGARFEQGTAWGGGVNTFEELGTLGTATINKLNAATVSITETYARAGDVLGYSAIRTQNFIASIDATGDVVAALSDSIGAQLVPAIALFQREGETLQQTAERLTETFKATNDFIVALGVSQDAAFGGFGLGGVAGRDALIAASGGLQAFTQNAQGFVKNFLTPAQQLQPALDDVGRTFSRLGIQGVSTNEQFAALVKQQMELGNTDVVAQLLSVADSFNAVATAAAETNKQLTALLRKDLFSTLVDYIRATTGGGAAAGMIAGATTVAGSVTAQEAAAAAALAGQMPVSAVAPNDASQTGGSVFGEIIKQFLDDLWSGLKNLFGRLMEPSIMVDLAKKMLDEWKMGLSGFFTWFANEFANLPGTLADVRNAFTWMLPPIVDVKNIFDVLKTTAFWLEEQFGGVRVALYQFVPSLDTVKSAFKALLDPIRWLGDLISSITGGGSWLPFANGGAFGASGVHAFAAGGAFTNGIYSSPTPFMFANGGGFSQGIMGEAGDEAVMPLQRGPDGRLGVSAHGGNGDVAAEVRALREEVNMLRRDNQAGQIAIATATQRTYKTLDRWNGEGLPPERIAG